MRPAELPVDGNFHADAEGVYVLSTSGILSEAYEMMQDGLDVCDIAASVQETLAKGLARIAVLSAEDSESAKRHFPAALPLTARFGKPSSQN